MDTTTASWIRGGTISVADAARMLGCSTDTVRRMIVCHLLVAWRPNPKGRKYRLYKRQVAEMASRIQEEAIADYRLMQGEFDF